MRPPLVLVLRYISSCNAGRIDGLFPLYLVCICMYVLGALVQAHLRPCPILSEYLYLDFFTPPPSRRHRPWHQN